MELDLYSIRVKRVTVGPGTKDLADLLRENKTVPDNFAFSYIMDLNPGIVDLDDIKQGDVIKLPRPDVRGTFLRGSFAYAVANSLPQHRQLDENVQAFSSKSGEVLAENTLFSEPSDRIRYEKLAARYSKTIAALRKLPINSSTRERVIGNSETAVKLLQTASGSKSINALTLDTLESLSFEVETISAEAEDKVNQFQVNVAVTVNGIPRPPKDDFRVVCKVESKFREDLIKGDAYSPKTSIRFYNLVDKDGLSSKLLSDDTNYYFWVERERDRKVISPLPETPFTIKKENNCPEALKDRYQLCIALSTTTPN
jgi:hypothetical protein